jgi:hypothetical protein
MRENGANRSPGTGNSGMAFSFARLACAKERFFPFLLTI